MNINNLYPTDASVPVGSTAGQFTDKLTARIPSLSPLTQESYWLGYISYDNLPLIMQHSKLYYADEDTVVIENDTVVDNYPCGYIEGVIRGGIYMEDDVYLSNKYYQYIRFLNDLHPEYSAAYLNANTYPVNATSIFFLYYLTVDGEVVAKGEVGEMPSFSINFNNSENDGLVGMMEFMQGLRTITKTLGQLTFDITIEDDLYETGHAEIASNEDPDTVMHLFINTMNLPDRGNINGTTGGDCWTAFAAKVKYEGEDETHSYNVVLHQIENMLRPLILYVKYRYGLVTNFTYNDEGTTHALFYSTGAEGEFSATELDSLDPATGYIYNGNLLAWSAYGSGGSNKRTYLCMVMPGKDLYKIFSLYMPRVDVSSNATKVQVSYINNVTYATDVNSSNEFLARLKTGDIADQTFKDDLRPWQYSSITENDFLEDDVPPYEPEPEPEDGEESGDSIDNQYRYFGASKFITQYALTRSQLELFGEKLWTSWADTLGDLTEMWKNFKLFIGGGGDTGSIDISTALDFIISLRVFPYDLTDSLMQDVNGIRLGRGVYPIDVGVVKKMISLIQYVDFGTINVPRPFGDYRDYENMNISLVLPYCGTTMLNPGDVVGRSLTCTYAVDLQSGTCEAFVYVTATGDSGQHKYNVAQMSGQIGALLPVTATNSGQIMSQRISDAASVAGLIVGEHTGRLGSLANALTGQFQSESGNVSGGLGGVGATMHPLMNPKTYAAVSEAANALSRPALECPSLGGGAGLSAFHQPAAPYIQMRYGIYAQPDNYNHAVGVPSTDNGVLSSYSGFVVCNNVDVSSLSCHTDEKAAIKAALESGVYV